MMAYLVRSMQSGGELARHLWRTMFANVESYLDEGVQAGTIKPSRDPAARARYLAMAGGGAFLLYLQLHDTPTDLRGVLHDYAEDMMMPALELYTEGLLTDSTMLDTFAAHGDTTPRSREKKMTTASARQRGLIPPRSKSRAWSRLSAGPGPWTAWT